MSLKTQKQKRNRRKAGAPGDNHAATGEKEGRCYGEKNTKWTIVGRLGELRTGYPVYTTFILLTCILEIIFKLASYQSGPKAWVNEFCLSEENPQSCFGYGFYPNHDSTLNMLLPQSSFQTLLRNTTLMAIAALIAGIILRFPRQSPVLGKASKAWMAIFAGLMGNLWDRVLFGYVVDYVTVFHKYVNLSDILIEYGVITLITVAIVAGVFGNLYDPILCGFVVDHLVVAAFVLNLFYLLLYYAGVAVILYIWTGVHPELRLSGSPWSFVAVWQRLESLWCHSLVQLNEVGFMMSQVWKEAKVPSSEKKDVPANRRHRGKGGKGETRRGGHAAAKGSQDSSYCATAWNILRRW